MTADFATLDLAVADIVPCHQRRLESPSKSQGAADALALKPLITHQRQSLFVPEEATRVEALG